MTLITTCSAGEEHAALIAGIIRESFRETAAILKITPDSHPNYAGFESADRVRTRLNSGDYAILAYSDDIAIGTVSYQIAPDSTDVGYIKRFAVLPNYRGLELGQILINHAERGLQKMGVIRAEISIVGQLKRLQRYYEGLGYQVFDQKTIPAFPFEIAFMGKSLSSLFPLSSRNSS